jgi:hypothetical protein
MSDLKFEIKRNLGVLAENSKGWRKEVNIVSWNDRKPKLDIREWDEQHDKMSKGLTFTREEAEELTRLLAVLDLEDVAEASQFASARALAVD